MTRKRFIKLMMSYGISRNEAVKTAAAYNSLNIPYETAYVKEVAGMLKSCISFDIGEFKQAIAKATVAINDFSSAIKRTFGRGVC